MSNCENKTADEKSCKEKIEKIEQTINKTEKINDDDDYCKSAFCSICRLNKSVANGWYKLDKDKYHYKGYFD